MDKKSLLKTYNDKKSPTLEKSHESHHFGPKIAISHLFKAQNRNTKGCDSHFKPARTRASKNATFAINRTIWKPWRSAFLLFFFSRVLCLGIICERAPALEKIEGASWCRARTPSYSHSLRSFVHLKQIALSSSPKSD